MRRFGAKDEPIRRKGQVFSPLGTSRIQGIKGPCSLFPNRKILRMNGEIVDIIRPYQQFSVARKLIFIELVEHDTIFVVITDVAHVDLVSRCYFDQALATVEQAKKLSMVSGPPGKSSNAKAVSPAIRADKRISDSVSYRILKGAELRMSRKPSNPKFGSNTARRDHSSPTPNMRHVL